jgi:hypothetical protein
MKSATINFRDRFIVVDFLATDLSVVDFAATENPLLVL